jgi:signal transduction histidine kinase
MCGFPDIMVISGPLSGQGHFMVSFMDRNRIYLVCFYFSMSFFYLSFVLEDQDPIPMLGYILALIIFIVTSHDSLLQVIVQATGQAGSKSELAYFSAFMDLNQKIHNFLELDDVLVLVDDTMKERIQANKTVYLVARSITPAPPGKEPKEPGGLKLRAWPAAAAWSFHDASFEAWVEQHGKVVSRRDAEPMLRKVFDETGTSLMIPVIQNEQLLCVILLGRLDNERPYTEFEYQMFGFLANQLSIILDRIRVYARVLQKTQMDHADKMQVMQSLSANIAHEMRTPLSGIRASISGCEEYFEQVLKAYELCCRQDPARFPPIREDYLARLIATPKRIQLMIDQANNVIDMLLMNLRENALDRRLLHQIDAAKLVHQAIDRYPFKTGEREKLKLRLEDNFSFLGVESLCIYVLFNLLKNAYYSLQSAQKGDISITLRRGERENYLIFRDTGLGIDEKIVGRIFDGFFTTKHDGTGAGLAFCKRTIESFGGQIGCRSQLGAYAEFTIVLPQPKAAGLSE